MLRLTILFICLLGTTSVFGSHLPDYVMRNSIYSSPYMILADAKRIVEKFGLEPMDLKNTGAIPLFEVDQIYADISAQHAVFLKFDLTLPGYEEKLVLVDDGFSFSFRVEDRFVTLFFSNYAESEALKISSEIKKNLQQDFQFSQTQTAKNTSIIIRKLANDGCNCGFKNPLNSSMANSLGLSLLGPLTQCFFTALRGTKQNLLEKLDTVKSFTLNPAKLWHAAVEKYRGVIVGIKQVYETVSQFSTQNFSFDFETIMELACTVIGQIVPDILLTAFTGAALAKLSQTILQLLSRLNKFKKMLDFISVARKSGDNFWGTKEFLRKAMSDSLSPEARKWIERFSPGNVKAAIRMATCD